jgi:carbonic anhydrase
LKDDSQGLPHVSKWITQIKDLGIFLLFILVEKHRDDLIGLSESTRQDIVSRLNAINNAKKVASSQPIQDAWVKGKKISVHAWCYRPSNGHLEKLGVEINSGEEIETLTEQAIYKCF